MLKSVTFLSHLRVKTALMRGRRLMWFILEIMIVMAEKSGQLFLFMPTFWQWHFTSLMPVGPCWRAADDIICCASASQHSWCAGRAEAERPELESRKNHFTFYTLFQGSYQCAQASGVTSEMNLACYLQNFPIALLLLSLCCHLKTFVAYGMYWTHKSFNYSPNAMKLVGGSVFKQAAFSVPGY